MGRGDALRPWNAGTQTALLGWRTRYLRRRHGDEPRRRGCRGRSRHPWSEPRHRYPPRFATLAPPQPTVGPRDQQDTVRVRHVAARQPGSCDGIPAYGRTEPMGFGRLTFAPTVRSAPGGRSSTLDDGSTHSTG